MRRNSRIKKGEDKSLSDKIITYSLIGVVVLAVIVFALVMYSKSLSDDVKDSTMSLEQMASIAEKNNENTESASTEIGKSVEESENEISTDNSINTANSNNTSNNTNSTNVTNNTNTANTSKSNTNAATTNANTSNAESKEKVQEEKKELSFERPVDGDIVREFAQDNLVYSETLKEWVTHSGIDIKAEKTTVVKAAEAGTIKSIKNDPRYGLTIVIEHDDNFQTVYSNLLTSEFVVEGEKVEKGQSIGTVGNTAVFEIADEPHLHFEILKDSLPVDPSIYIK